MAAALGDTSSLTARWSTELHQQWVTKFNSKSGTQGQERAGWFHLKKVSSGSARSLTLHVQAYIYRSRHDSLSSYLQQITQTWIVLKLSNTEGVAAEAHEVLRTASHL